jgi:cholesterol transport system auxiliary component
MKPSGALATLAVAAMTLGLGACVTVFPKRPPSQFYSFGQSFPAQPSTSAGGPRINVVRSLTVFNRAAAGDRILTSNGDQAAYIASSEWVSPAAVLFDEAESRAFEADNGVARLVRPGAMSGLAADLRLDVQTFEVRYPGDLKAAPTVVIRVHATLTSMSDRHVIGEQTFESKQPAGDNRVGAIVHGFDAGTVDVLGQIVAWTDSQVAALPPPA